jgi:hypothetical protein
MASAYLRFAPTRAPTVSSTRRRRARASRCRPPPSSRRAAAPLSPDVPHGDAGRTSADSSTTICSASRSTTDQPRHDPRLRRVRFARRRDELAARPHDDLRREAVRLDSTWTLDFPERLATLRVGDAISASGAWGRSVRFGGVQFGTNFSTQPTLVTTPLLYAQGEAIVPSTVDVFVNNRRWRARTCRPGRSPSTSCRRSPVPGRCRSWSPTRSAGSRSSRSRTTPGHAAACRAQRVFVRGRRDPRGLWR